MSDARLVISLDFELMWGVRDHRTVADYGDAIIGGRAAIPKMLDLFRRYGVSATWATVGLLFARNRDEMLDHAPPEKPTYDDPRLSPYDAIAHEVGADEDADPLHYGRSLVDRIADTPGQEIASHTYAHFYCLEAGQSAGSFAADIAAANSIARQAGHDLRSIVFPRNQMTPEHIALCAAQGIDVFRGNPEGFANDPRSGKQNTKVVRAARLIDSVLPLFGNPAVALPAFHDGVINVRASRFFRAYSPRLPRLSEWQDRKILSELRQAARKGQQYHLWWHPHNMGRDTDRNLARLETVLKEYHVLHDQFGMQSASMRDIAVLQRDRRGSAAGNHP